MKRLAAVVFNGDPLGIMSFAFGVFDLARHYGAVPGRDVRVVAGEPGTVLGDGDLNWPVPYDMSAVLSADLVIISDWEDRSAPAAFPPHRRHGARCLPAAFAVDDPVTP